MMYFMIAYVIISFLYMLFLNNEIKKYKESADTAASVLEQKNKRIAELNSKLEAANKANNDNLDTADFYLNEKCEKIKSLQEELYLLKADYEIQERDLVDMSKLLSKVKFLLVDIKNETSDARTIERINEILHYGRT